MEIRRRNQTITRYRPPCVTPLELWDLWIGQRILWETMQETAFPEMLLNVLVDLRRGGGATRSEGRVPAAITGFDAIFVAGGRSQESPIRSALTALNLPICFSATPQNPGRNAGLGLLAQQGGVTPWVCDLGQASFKLCSADASRQFPRDLRQLPIRKDSPDEVIDGQRQDLRRWMAESLRTFAETTTPPDALLFALPSRLDDTGIPEGSSYVGMTGDSSLIADSIDAAGLNPRIAMCVNDAELAALDAVVEPTLAHSAKILVITLGFGLGAALVTRVVSPSHA